MGWLKILSFSLAITVPIVSIGADAERLSNQMLVARISGEHFATETVPAGKVALQADLRSDRLQAYSDREIPSAQLRLYSFFETDRHGNRSLDIDSAVLRVSPFSGHHLWIGRSHPLAEGTPETVVTTTSAIGTHWVQNQSDPLQSRVTGWLGLGTHLEAGNTGIYLNGVYSPFFLPSFGPSIDFSENADATGPRFARLPPSKYPYNDVKFPLRYRIRSDNVRDIVVQPQYFLEIGHDLGWQRISLMTWSAPTPSPRTSATGVARVRPNEVSVLATVEASFPREYFYATRWLFKFRPFELELEGAHERASNRTTLSAAISVGEALRAGYLTTLSGAPSTPTGTEGAASLHTPEYGEELLWTELSIRLLRGRWLSSLRVEAHLRKDEEDRWIRPMTEYVFDTKVSIFAVANILTGESGSYLGAWRALDSVAAGGQFRW